MELPFELDVRATMKNLLSILLCHELKDDPTTIVVLIQVLNTPGLT